MRIFGILVIIVVLLVGGALVAPQFIDWNQYKGEIIAQIEKNTGFQAKVDGDLDLSVLPMPHVVVNGLSLSHPQDTQPLLTLDNASVYLDVMPLISGNISLKSITLDKPDIALRVLKDGTQNWMTETLTPVEEEGESTADTAKAPSSNVAIGSLSIKDGRVSYKDDTSGSEHIISNINGKFSMPSLQGPFDVAASFEAMGYPLDVNAETEILNTDNKTITANIKAGTKGADLNFSGIIGYADGFDAQGETGISIANLKDFLETVTKQEQDASLDMQIKTNGIASVTQNSFKYTDLTATIGPETLKGAISADNFNNYPSEAIKITTDLSGANNTLIKMVASLSGSQVKLANSSFAYKSSKASGDVVFTFPQDNQKGDLSVALTSPSLNVDELMALTGQKKSSSAKSGGSVKDSTKSLNLPFDANVGIAADKIIYQGTPIQNVKIDGALSGSKVTLKTLSVSDYAGAGMSVGGTIGNIQELTGLSLNGSFKTADIEAFMAAIGQTDALKSAPTKIGAVNVSSSFSGHLDSLAFDTKVDALDASITAKGIAKNVETSPSFSDMVLGLKHPNLASLMQTLSPGSEKNAALSKAVDISAQVSLDNNIYKLDALSGSFGPITVNGNLVADMTSSKPVINGELKTGKLPLDSFIETSEGTAKTTSAQTKSTNTGRWSNDPIDTAWLNSADIDLKMASSEIIYGGWAFNNPSFTLVMKDGSLNVDGWNAGLFGGTSNLDLQLTGGKNVSLKTVLKLDNVGLQSLVVALAGSPIIQSNGVADMQTELSASGQSMSALINALKGNGTINGTDITIRGIDVAEMTRALSGAGNFGDQAKALFGTGIKGGSSKFENLDGEFAVTNGVVNFSKLDLNGNDAVVTTRGNVSLPAWTLDMKSSVQLIVPADTEVPPPFEISYRGSLSNPGSSFAQNAIEGYLNKKISAKANKLIQDKLGDKLDGELGGLVGGLLGVKPKIETPTAPAPAPSPVPDAAPANDNAIQQQETPAAASPYTPENAQPAEPEQPKKVEPEDVIKDVLKGFLR